MIALMIYSCHDVIFYSFFLPESGVTKLHNWVDSCMVFYYLGTQLHGNQFFSIVHIIKSVQLHIFL